MDAPEDTLAEDLLAFGFSDSDDENGETARERRIRQAVEASKQAYRAQVETPYWFALARGLDVPISTLACPASDGNSDADLDTYRPLCDSLATALATERRAGPELEWTLASLYARGRYSDALRVCVAILRAQTVLVPPLPCSLPSLSAQDSAVYGMEMLSQPPDSAGRSSSSHVPPADRRVHSAFASAYDHHGLLALRCALPTLPPPPRHASKVNTREALDTALRSAWRLVDQDGPLHPNIYAALVLLVRREAMAWYDGPTARWDLPPPTWHRESPRSCCTQADQKPPAEKEEDVHSKGRKGGGKQDHKPDPDPFALFVPPSKPEHVRCHGSISNKKKHGSSGLHHFVDDPLGTQLTLSVTALVIYFFFCTFSCVPCF